MGYKEGDRISEDIVYDILSETDYSITDEEWTMFAAEHNIKFYSDDNSGKQFFE